MLHIVLVGCYEPKQQQDQHELLSYIHVQLNLEATTFRKAKVTNVVGQIRQLTGHLRENKQTTYIGTSKESRTCC